MASDLPYTIAEPASTTQLAPRFQVLLHDDDHHAMDYVALCLMRVFGFGWPEAWAVMSEAHCTGMSLCKVEPQETAEHHRDRLCSLGLTVTIEPDRR